MCSSDLACAGELELTPTAPVTLSSLKDPEQRKNWREQKHMIAFGLQNTRARIPVMVDVLIAPPLDIEQALARAVERDVDGLSIKLAAVDDMIALKQGTGRLQDISDIEHLERLRGR